MRVGTGLAEKSANPVQGGAEAVGVSLRQIL